MAGPSSFGRVEHQRRAALLPSDSDAPSEPDVYLSLCIRLSGNTDVCRSAHPSSAESFNTQAGEKELLNGAFAPEFARGPQPARQAHQLPPLLTELTMLLAIFRSMK